MSSSRTITLTTIQNTHLSSDVSDKELFIRPQSVETGLESTLGSASCSNRHRTTSLRDRCIALSTVRAGLVVRGCVSGVGDGDVLDCGRVGGRLGRW